jgi:hypothetical protein
LEFVRVFFLPLKKTRAYEKILVVKPVIYCFNSYLRQTDIIEMYAQQGGNYKLIVVYQNKLNKSVLLRCLEFSEYAWGIQHVSK